MNKTIRILVITVIALGAISFFVNPAWGADPCAFVPSSKYTGGAATCALKCDSFYDSYKCQKACFIDMAVTDGTCPNTGEVCCMVGEVAPTKTGADAAAPAAPSAAKTTTVTYDKTLCDVPGYCEKCFPCPLGGGADKLPQIFGRVIRWVLGLVGALFFAMFIYGGFLYIVAGDNSKNAETGKKTLVNAVIGLAIVIGSYMFVSWLVTTFNTGLGINPPTEPAVTADQTSQPTGQTTGQTPNQTPDQSNGFVPPACLGTCLPSCSKAKPKLTKLPSGTCPGKQECCSDNPY